MSLPKLTVEGCNYASPNLNALYFLIQLFPISFVAPPVPSALSISMIAMPHSQWLYPAGLFYEFLVTCLCTLPNFGNSIVVSSTFSSPLEYFNPPAFDHSHFELPFSLESTEEIHSEVLKL